MKKTTLFALSFSVVAVSFFAGFCVSKEPVPPKATESQQEKARAQTAAGGPISPETARSVQQDRLQSLRRHFMILIERRKELTEQRVETMDEKELKAEIARLQKELGEDEAEAKLQEAVTILSKVVNSYPASNTAVQYAVRMLQVPRFPDGPEKEQRDLDQ